MMFKISSANNPIQQPLPKPVGDPPKEIRNVPVPTPPPPPKTQPKPEKK